MTLNMANGACEEPATDADCGPHCEMGMCMRTFLSDWFN